MIYIRKEYLYILCEIIIKRTKMNWKTVTENLYLQNVKKKKNVQR